MEEEFGGSVGMQGSGRVMNGPESEHKPRGGDLFAQRYDESEEDTKTLYEAQGAAFKVRYWFTWNVDGGYRMSQKVNWLRVIAEVEKATLQQKEHWRTCKDIHGNLRDPWDPEYIDPPTLRPIFDAIADVARGEVEKIESGDLTDANQ